MIMWSVMFEWIVTRWILAFKFCDCKNMSTPTFAETTAFVFRTLTSVLEVSVDTGGSISTLIANTVLWIGNLLVCHIQCKGPWSERFHLKVYRQSIRWCACKRCAFREIFSQGSNWYCRTLLGIVLTFYNYGNVWKTVYVEINFTFCVELANIYFHGLNQ